MSVSLAVHPSLLTLAVVALAVRSLHNASGTPSIVTMAVTMPVAVTMTMAGISHAAARLIHEHDGKDGQSDEGGCGRAEELVDGRHVDLVDVL